MINKVKPRITPTIEYNDTGKEGRNIIIKILKENTYYGIEDVRQESRDKFCQSKEYETGETLQSVRCSREIVAYIGGGWQNVHCTNQGVITAIRCSRSI